MQDRTPIRVLGLGLVLALAATLAWPRDLLTLSGAQLYSGYCASCHGAQGEGDGPRAQTNKKPPADLSRMAERAGGVFPRERVVAALSDPASRRTTGMPSGRYLFSQLGDSAAKLKMIYKKLADHIETLQQK